VSEYKFLWNKVIEVIKSSTSESIFQSFFSVVHPLSFDNNQFIIQVDSPLVADWLKQKYANQIESLLSEETDKKIKLSIKVKSELETETNLINKSVAESNKENNEENISPKKKKNISSNLNPNFLFENFIVGGSNQMAHAAAFASGQNPGHVYNPLFIYGGVGLGKTHLMQAIGNANLVHHPDINVNYISCERFINHYIDGIQNNSLPKFRNLYREHTDVLLIDDIQFLAKKERTQEEFFHTFDTLLNAGKQIVMTCDKSPHELENIEERLVNRFEWGMVVDIQSPNFETRVAIINKKLENFGKFFDDEVCFYLANKVRNDVRKIEGAIIKLLGFASVQNKPVTLDMAKECLRDYIVSPTVTLESIQKTVADFFNLRINELCSSKRSRNISHPRQIAMFFCRTLTNSSLNEIAQCFGGKDHTTVLYACRKIDNEKMENELVNQEILTLKKRIAENS